jgi:hypothetical protein
MHPLFLRLTSVTVSVGILWVLFAGGESSAGTSRTVVYENPARTSFEKFSEDSWVGGNIVPQKPLKSQAEDILFDETTGVRLHDCSDATYRCIFGSFRVFALPRNRLSPGAAYTAGGSAFKVEECFRGDSRICQAALVSSHCPRRVGADACKQATAGLGDGEESGPAVYFIYNEDHGITAYGTVKEAPKTRDEKLAIATQMLLKGELGILAN